MGQNTSLRITIDDVIKAGFCASGARSWFRTHQIDFAAFLRDGIDAQLFLERGDHLAQVVVDRKREREGLTNG
jgi:hypothetical protein